MRGLKWMLCVSHKSWLIIAAIFLLFCAQASYSSAEAEELKKQIESLPQ
jgi:hypothetical protein